MKKKILFVAPDHYSFYKVIEDGFIKYTNLEVFTVISNGSYIYKNKLEKIKNFFYKTFLNKNLKIINAHNHTYNQINKYKNYEYFFAIRPDILTDEALLLAKKKSNKSIANYWDSFDKIKGQLETMKFFSHCYSFDSDDCKKYDLIKSTNFYFNTESFIKPAFDVFFLGTFDKRYSKLIEILTYLNSIKINAKATIFSYEKYKAVENKNEFVNFIHDIVPFPEAVTFHQNTKIILDVQHDNQVGLSFRPYDALGMKKKLITTNNHIKKYDFYNQNNIFIWTDETKEIPISFFESPYCDLPTDIYEKYSLENWVKTILS